MLHLPEKHGPVAAEHCNRALVVRHKLFGAVHEAPWEPPGREGAAMQGGLPT